MIDQSFSPKNIEAIFDAENKKGTNIEKKFEVDFSDSLALTRELKELRYKIKYERDRLDKFSLIDDLNNSKEKREETLKDVFEKIADKIKNYKPEIRKKIFKDNAVYVLTPCVESYFYSKILQKNLRDTYNIKQNSRYHILKTLIHFVADRFPKIIIRTDIKGFYESIPQKDVLNELNKHNLITANTKRSIKNTLGEFNKLTNNITEIGLPRGIGISAYLSEIYMSKIDSEIKKMDDLIYYARYVDDIVAIYVPNENKKLKANHYKELLENTISTNSNGALILNNEKTVPFDLQSDYNKIKILDYENHEGTLQISSQKYNKGIHYLGYIIGSKKTKTSSATPAFKDSVAVDISDQKVIDFKDKITLAFLHFENKKRHNPVNSLKLLKSRLQYLMTNTKLSNNKSNVFVGLYYSYPFITEQNQLQELDNFLVEKIGTTGLNQTEISELKKYSFVEYYRKRKFIKHSLFNIDYRSRNKELKNRGIIKFGITEITSIWRTKSYEI